MARKLAREGVAEGGGQSTDGPSDEQVAIDRRRYVRYAAAAVAAVGATTGRTAASEGSDDDPQRQLLIEGNDEVSRYEITVGGDLAPGTDASSDATARISGCSAEGVLRDESRRYRFTGEIRDFYVDDDADVYLENVRSGSLTPIEQVDASLIELSSQ